MANVLTQKQRTFCDAYLLDPSGTRAAKAAGYKNPRQYGWLVMQKPHVRAEIERLQAERAKRVAIDSDWVLKELHSLYQRLVQDVKPAVSSKTGRPLTDDESNPIYRFEANAALKALELIGKHLKVSAFQENIKIGVDQTMAERILAGRKRARLTMTRDEAVARIKGAKVVAVEDSAEPPAALLQSADSKLKHGSEPYLN